MQFPESLTPRNASSTASADPAGAQRQGYLRRRRPQARPAQEAAYSGVVPVLGGGDPTFRDDDGSADPRAAAALAAFAAGEGSEHAALTALARSRLLVPVVAAEGGEKGTEMALPTLVGRDGRRAVPAFTCLDALARWQPTARPVPASAALVWRAAVDDSCAVVVDIAGPVPLAVDDARLAALADGRPAPLPHEDPDVLSAVRAAAAGQGAITGFRAGAGQAGDDLEVQVMLAAGCAADEAAEAVRRLGAAVMARLGGRLRRGIAIAVVPR
jgi:SseB protein N-terminal domain